MTIDLSAFYFDIRKDALYCDPYSSLNAQSLPHRARSFVPLHGDLACADAAASPPRRLGWRAIPTRTLGSSRMFPDVPASWRDDALAEKWRKVRNRAPRRHRRARIERAGKRIGSSLEAAPIVYVADPDLFAALVDVDLAEIVHHLGRHAGRRRGPGRRVPVATMSRPSRSSRGWRRGANARAPGKFRPPSAAIRNIPDVTPRDAQALREWDAMRKAAE